MTTITRTISDWACSVQYEDLPAEVVTEAKRFLMDSVGCALGGAQQHDVHIAREVLGEMRRIRRLPRSWSPASAGTRCRPRSSTP